MVILVSESDGLPFGLATKLTGCCSIPLVTHFAMDIMCQINSKTLEDSNESHGTKDQLRYLVKEDNEQLKIGARKQIKSSARINISPYQGQLGSFLADA